MVISSIFGKSFPFPFPYFVLSIIFKILKCIFYFFQEQVGKNVAETLSSPYTLHVGLNCIENGSCNSVGHLNTDEDTLNFTSNEAQLVIQSSGAQSNPSYVVDKLLVYGLEVTTATPSVTVSPQDCGGDRISAIVEVQDSVLRIQNLKVDLSCSSVTISWTFN